MFRECWQGLADSAARAPQRSRTTEAVCIVLRSPRSPRFRFVPSEARAFRLRRSFSFSFGRWLDTTLGVELIIRPDRQSASQLVARIVANELRINPRLVLGLATGGTMESVYALLVKEHRESKLDFSQCQTFNLDEYVGLAASDKNSYHQFMYEHLFSHVNIDLRNTHLPSGLSPDLEGECQRYEGMILEAGGIDLQLLGIGKAGHIGFNEPLSALRSRTRVKALAPTTIKQNAPLFDDPTKMPRRAITMGVGTILEARRCLLLATGAAKADIIAQAVEGPITSMVTASALQLHPRCTVIVDEDASRKLKEKEYYRWIFENEPEWESYR